MENQIFKWAKELQSLAQAGLFYGHSDFDKERYLRIFEISTEMMMQTEIPVEKLTNLFCGDIGYQTPKINTKAAIFQNEKILLVKEWTGKWSMPGGWCDYNLSPAENIVKEVKEETGLDVVVKKIISIQDRNKHNIFPHPYGVVKIFFLCEAIGGNFTPNIETSESRYFSLNELPPLDLEKTTEEQVKMCLNACVSNHWQVQFD